MFWSKPFYLFNPIKTLMSAKHPKIAGSIPGAMSGFIWNLYFLTIRSTFCTWTNFRMAQATCSTYIRFLSIPAARLCSRELSDYLLWCFGLLKWISVNICIFSLTFRVMYCAIWVYYFSHTPLLQILDLPLFWSKCRRRNSQSLWQRQLFYIQWKLKSNSSPDNQISQVNSPILLLTSQ
jgi:hypothetical protein